MANTDFSERLTRIEAGTGHTRHTLFVGMDDSFSVAPKPRAQGSQRAGAAGSALSFAGAFVLGWLAVFIGTVARYHLMGLPGPEVDPDIAMAINGATGVGVAFALGWMFRLRSKEHLLAQSVGVFAALCLIHNAVHLAPELFALIYAPEWVNHVLTLTEFRSASVRGVTLPF